MTKSSHNVDLPSLPEDAEVLRASGDCICELCGLSFRKHTRFKYPWGDGSCVKACELRDGKPLYLHL